MADAVRVLMLSGFVYLLGCQNYQLDDKIRNSLQGNASGAKLSALTPASVNYTYSNKNPGNFALAASGGTAPYTYTIINANLGGQIIASISGSTLNLAVNTGSTPASVPAGQTQLGSVTVSATDAVGISLEAVVGVEISYKRAFITSGTDALNFGAWSGGFAACSGQPTLSDKVNCVCQNAAASGNLKNPQKFRAWLSSSSSNAICNISDNANQACTSVAATDGGPWYATHGPRLARDLGSSTGLLSATPLETPLNTDEFGTTQSGVEAYTGTQATGLFGQACTGT